MKIHIDDHFTFSKLLRFTLFPIVMMIFTSLYSIVDGIFIANFASNSAFAAVNLAFPIVMIVGSIGFMFGTGGTALVSKLLGEKKEKEANETFSLIVYVTIGVGIALSIAMYFSIDPIMRAMGNISTGTTQEMVEEAILYGKILMIGQPIVMLQYLFHPFFSLAEKQKLGFIFTIASGVTNMILDALLIGVAKLGVTGAAVATFSGYIVGGIGPMLYFIFKKDGIIHIGKSNHNFVNIGKAAYNGMSEFLANIAMNVVSIVYNAQLLKAYGENGVAAYGIIMYVSFVFFAIFIGYALGMSPIVGYNYGAKNHEELHNILMKSVVIIMITSLVMFLTSFLSAKLFSKAFSNGNIDLEALATQGLRIYSVAFLFCGIGSFSTSFFTALNNGTVSAIISLCRTLLFQIGFVFILPLLFGAVGIWWAIVVGEVLSTFMSVIFLITLQKKYQY